MKQVLKNIVLIGFSSFMFGNVAEAQDGEVIFKQKCAACHRTDTKRMVGPGLGNIKDKRNQEWLISWIKDSQSLIKSGDTDAKAIYEEYNQIMMTPFPELSDADIIAMLDYLQGDAPASGNTETTPVEPVEPEKPIEFTADDAAQGKLLFDGSKRFVNGGASCVSCHNVNNNNVINGGLLAKDLTNVFDRMGHAGISGILTSPPFPAMASAYATNPLTEEEILQLSAFFKDANDISATQKANDGFGMFLGGGFAGLIVLLIIVSILWNNRKKESTKKDIFERQLRGNDSKVY